MKLIGLSLSGCILDILLGRVSLTNVKVIVANTKFTNEQEFEQVISQYQRYMWSKDPQLAATIARFLYDNNRIMQPRLYGFGPHNHQGKRWIEEDQHYTIGVVPVSNF